ncbi:MAG: hypothetical protein NTV80_17460 [Verrucomicrobia bacterium]|nr:hypothetical protein [Verrucomicrobiota bacterium]
MQGNLSYCLFHVIDTSRSHLSDPYRSNLKMRLLQLFTVLPLLVLVTGCGEPKADLSAPKTHRSGATTFDYPKNWKITEESIDPTIHSLFVETPGDALVIFQSFPIDGADSLSAFSKAFSDIAKTETPIGKIAGSTFTNMPKVDGYEWIEEVFDIKLLGESAPHRRIYCTKSIGDKQVFLIFQVSTEDYVKTEAGFKLISKSLRGLQTTEDEHGEKPATGSELK